MAAIALQLDSAPTAGTPHARLRQACDEFAGMALFGQLLKNSRQSCLNSGLMESPAQRIFQSQLDDVLMQRASGRSVGGVGEALYRHLAPALGPAPAGGQLDLRG